MQILSISMMKFPFFTFPSKADLGTIVFDGEKTKLLRSECFSKATLGVRTTLRATRTIPSSSLEDGKPAPPSSL
jgi:hypothetical protein